MSATPHTPIKTQSQTHLPMTLTEPWVGNLEFFADDGQLVAIGDLVFEHLHLIIEIDGSGHLTPDQVRHDRARDLWLGARGWSVHRIGADVTLDATRFVGIVRALVGAREAVLMAGVGTGPGAPSRRARGGRPAGPSGETGEQRRRRPGNTVIRNSPNAAASGHARNGE